MKTFKVTSPDGLQTEWINRTDASNVKKFLSFSDRQHWDIEEVELYEELRIIGLTHNQCDAVSELLERMGYKQV
jgi:hypothetical protein